MTDVVHAVDIMLLFQVEIYIRTLVSSMDMVKEG